MRVLMTGGGTAGHINPALAIAAKIRQEQPDAEILFVGAKGRMETRLVPAAGYRIETVAVQGFQRRLTLKNIGRNVSAAYHAVTAQAASAKILREFRPDIAIGTGGYVSGPVLREGAKLGYPTLTHESNAYPGITTKALARTADRVLLSVEEAKRYLPPNRPYVVTGNPVREEILFADRRAAREKLGVGERICIVSFGGSLGARRINEAVAQLMAWEQQAGGFYHIHATGRYEKPRFPGLLAEAGVDPAAPGLDVREYINDMADCLAAADLVISRSGAMTLSELEASGTASILIPSPNVAENHQYHNAMVLQNHDAAVVVQEKELTPQLLRETVQRLTDDPAVLRRLGQNAQSMAILDANERIYQEILALLPSGG